MNIKKMSGSLAVAVSLLALNGVATADDNMSCGDLAAVDADGAPVGAIIELREYVVCDVAAADIWQQDDDTTVADETVMSIWLFGKSKKNSELNGCSVHEKVNKLLYEVRDTDATSPPWKGNDNGKNGPKGAWHALIDGNPTYAADLLGEFVRVLDENANAKEGRQGDEDEIRGRAFDLQQEIYDHCF